MKAEVHILFVCSLLLSGCGGRHSDDQTRHSRRVAEPVVGEQLLGTYEGWVDDGHKYNMLRLDTNGTGILTVWYDFSPTNEGSVYPVKWTVRSNTLEVVCQTLSPGGYFWGTVFSADWKDGVGNRVRNLRLSEQGIEWVANYLLIREEVSDMARQEARKLMARKLADPPVGSDRQPAALHPKRGLMNEQNGE